MNPIVSVLLMATGAVLVYGYRRAVDELADLRTIEDPSWQRGMGEAFAAMARSAQQVGVALEQMAAAARQLSNGIGPFWPYLGLNREPVDWVEWLRVTLRFAIKREWRKAKFAWVETRREFSKELA